jgi:CheY-like chemotaxis protein
MATKKNMFVVEDEEDILELLRYHLTREGYTVRTAVTGEEAVKGIAQKAPNLVLLDPMLPGLDGLEVCRTLMYLAIPVERDGSAIAVVRAALPLSVIDWSVRHVRRHVLIGALLAAAL